MSVQKLLKTLYSFLCILGCSYQVFHIAQLYFSYKTVTSNQFYEPQFITFPELHNCFRYIEDALDWDAIKMKYDDYSNISHIKNWLDVITIADIFEYTPNGDIDSCMYRDSTGHTMNIQAENCTFFNISKYVQQQYVCYRFVAKENISFDFKFIYNSLYKERELYEVFYSGKLSESKKIRPTLAANNYPIISNAYTPVYYQSPGNGFSLQLSCQKFHDHYLGYPYDRFVCENSNENYFECFDSCLTNHTMKYLSRVPYSSFHKESMNEKMISSSILQNETNLQLLTYWNKACQISCPMYPCDFDYCITSGHTASPKIDMNDRKKEKRIDDTLVYSKSIIKVMSPTSPDISITYVPNLSFLDLMIYSFSSFGTWFGLVIISLNPVSLITRSYDVIKKKLISNEGPIVHQNLFHRRRVKRVRIDDTIGL